MKLNEFCEFSNFYPQAYPSGIAKCGCDPASASVTPGTCDGPHASSLPCRRGAWLWLVHRSQEWEADVSRKPTAPRWAASGAVDRRGCEPDDPDTPAHLERLSGPAE